jgi:hypothetical protein
VGVLVGVLLADGMLTVDDALAIIDLVVGSEFNKAGKGKSLEKIAEIEKKYFRGKTSSVAKSHSGAAPTAGNSTVGSATSPQINPADVANKTPGQIDQFAQNQGLIPKGPSPQSGKGAYVDPVTGKQRVLCHTNCSNPHAHVNNAQGERLDINGNVVPPESPDAHLPIKYP